MLKVRKPCFAAPAQYRLGTVMVWVGVFCWVPYLVLHILGEKPSFLWFLPFHLLGVVGGAHLRRLARKSMPAMPEKKGVYRLVGHSLIFLGVLVWAPYLYLRYAAHQPVTVMGFLPFHLAGVLGGLIILGVGFLQTLGQRER